MQHKTTIPFLISVAVLAVSVVSIGAMAETVLKKTVTQAPPAPGNKLINLKDFDLNNDNLLSTFEVGEMMFRYFDMNSDTRIDPTEYENKTIITVAPMEQTVSITYDYDNDGVPDKTQYTYETFTQNTQLARFDANKDGLSPHEFVNMTMADVDSDRSGGIDVTEWRNAYIAFIKPPVPVSN